VDQDAKSPEFQRYTADSGLIGVKDGRVVVRRLADCLAYGSVLVTSTGNFSSVTIFRSSPAPFGFRVVAITA
jgi:hypothetical protein